MGRTKGTMTVPLAVKWIREKGYHHKTDQLTHVSLSKGSYCIPYSAMHEFHKVCAESISRNEPLHFVEVKGELFRFFVDVDYKSKLALEPSEVQSLSQAIYESVKKYIADPSLSKAIVCITKPKQLGESSGFKTGIHMIWPDVVVDSFLASLLSKQLIMDLEGAFGPRQDQPWSDVIDASVYKHKKTGLRMKFCSKPEDATRIYKPTYVFGDDTLNLKDWSIADLLDLCSIRTDKVDKTHILRDEIEDNLIHQEEEAQFIAQTGCSELAPVDDIQCSTLEEYIRRNFTKHKITKLRKVLKVDKKDKYIIFVDSKFCLNMNRCHKSNNVYFIATKEGIAQRCFCNCKTKENRIAGYCMDYQSPWNDLQPTLQQVLFGNKGKKKSVFRKDELASEWDRAEEYLDSLCN